MKHNHIGEVKLHKPTGARMMVTGYKSDKDITVTVYPSGVLNVDDVITVLHVAYKDFLDGDLKIDISHIGETYVNKAGQEITLVTFRDYNDVDVFNTATGKTTKHITYDNFRRGSLSKSQKNLTGYMRRMKNGLIATIIAQPDKEHVDVIFQHGLILKNVLLKDYMNGDLDFTGLYNPNLRYERVGEKRLSNSGRWMTIVAYKGTHHVDILFDNGFLVTDKDYRNFRTGEIQSDIGRKRKLYRVGETKIDRHGNQLKIVKYTFSWDMIVERTDKDGNTDTIKTNYDRFTRA